MTNQGRGKIIAVFARADHPKGWGMPGTFAHGFVVAAVVCKSYDQMNVVVKAVERKGLPEPDGHPYHWFGGRGFDHVYTIIDTFYRVGDFAPSINNMPVIIKWPELRGASLGENRAAFIFEAGPLLRDIGRLP